MLAERVGELRPDMGVLMTTGYNEELVDDGHARTNADILGKPYRRSELFDRVRQALNGRGDRSGGGWHPSTDRSRRSSWPRSAVGRSSADQSRAGRDAHPGSRNKADEPRDGACRYIIGAP